MSSKFDIFLFEEITRCVDEGSSVDNLLGFPESNFDKVQHKY